MTTQNDNLGNLFREAFRDYEKQPGEGLWEKIAAQQPALVPAPKAFPRKGWYFIGGGAALIATLCVVYFSINSQQDAKLQPESAQQKLVQPLAPLAAAETTSSDKPSISETRIKEVVTTPATERSSTASEPSNASPLTTTAPQESQAEVAQSNKQQRIANNITPITTGSTTPPPATPPATLSRLSESLDLNETKGESGTVNKLSLPENKTICLGDELLLPASGGKFYHWSTGETTESIRVIPQSSTYYSLTVTLNDNTQKVHHVRIDVKECATLYIADAFSPNGDGVNDEFLAFGTNISRFSMKIYSANGQMMFETNDINQGWNGRFKGGDAPGDVYFYVVNFTDSNGQPFVRKGRLFLLR